MHAVRHLHSCCHSALPAADRRTRRLPAPCWQQHVAREVLYNFTQTLLYHVCICMCCCLVRAAPTCSVDSLPGAPENGAWTADGGCTTAGTQLAVGQTCTAACLSGFNNNTGNHVATCEGSPPAWNVNPAALGCFGEADNNAICACIMQCLQCQHDQWHPPQDLHVKLSMPCQLQLPTTHISAALT
jgi:hypothetical protein